MKYFDCFEYSELSPSGLFWKINSGWTGRYFINKIGDAVGTICYQEKTGKPQCWKVKFNGKYLGVHRIIYEMHNDVIPENMIVDHVNRNPLDNSITNLRVISKTTNNRNYSKYRNNTSGKTGVQITKDGRFRVMWYENGKKHSKSFTISKFGYDEAKDLAFSFRDSVLERLKITHNYSTTHGE